MTTLTDSVRDLDRVEDRIRMHRQVERETILLVEGPSDALVLRPLIDNVKVFAANTKSNVYSAISALGSWGITGVRGVVDRDFDEDAEVTGIIAWQGRDLENMLIGLGVLADVIEHQGSDVKIAKVGGAGALVDRLVKSLSEVSRLRRINTREGLGLPFDDVSLASKVSQKTLVLDFTSYLTSLLSKAGYPVQVDQLKARVSSEEDDALGPRGKDVVALAGVALRSVAGNLKAHACDEPVLSGQLRSSAQFALHSSEWIVHLRRELEDARVEMRSSGAPLVPPKDG